MVGYKEEIEIRSATIRDWDSAIELAWRTFLRFEAKDYEREGVQSFRDFLSDAVLRRMFVLGSYPMKVAVKDDHIVGMISLRDKKHISLLFVDGKYHGCGIGRSLVEVMAEEIVYEGADSMTVNAAPYAVGFYHHLGFKDVAPELRKQGIRYTPMEKSL